MNGKLRSLKKFDSDVSLGETDGLFSGSKGLEIVQLLCGQCFGDCHKQQPYVAAVAIFKIALVVIF